MSRRRWAGSVSTIIALVGVLIGCCILLAGTAEAATKSQPALPPLSIAEADRIIAGAWQFIGRGEFGPAIKQLTDLLARNPSDGVAVHALMVAHRTTAIDEAIDIGQRFLQLPPLNELVVANEEMSSTQTARFAQLTNRVKAITLAQTESVAVLNLFCQLLVHAITESPISRWSKNVPVMERARFGRAVTAPICKRACELNPSDHVTHFSLSLAYVKHESWDRAGSEYLPFSQIQRAILLLDKEKPVSPDDSARQAKIEHMYRTQYCRMLCWNPEYDQNARTSSVARRSINLYVKSRVLPCLFCRCAVQMLVGLHYCAFAV